MTHNKSKILFFIPIIKLLTALIFAGTILSGCVGREGRYGDTSYSESKGLGMIAIEKQARQPR